MFDELSARFEDAVKGLKGEDKISDTNVEGALKDVRRALAGSRRQPSCGQGLRG